MEGRGAGLVCWFSVEEFAFDLCKGISRPTTSSLTPTVEVSFSDPFLLCRLFVQQRYLLQVFVRIIICEKKAGCAHFLLRFPSLPLSPALIPLCKDLPDLETAPGIWCLYFISWSCSEHWKDAAASAGRDPVPISASICLNSIGVGLMGSGCEVDLSSGSLLRFVELPRQRLIMPRRWFNGSYTFTVQIFPLFLSLFHTWLALHGKEGGKERALMGCSVLLQGWLSSEVITDRPSSLPPNSTLPANGTGENLCSLWALTGTCQEVYNWNEGLVSLVFHLEEAGSDSLLTNGQCWPAQVPIPATAFIFLPLFLFLSACCCNCCIFSELLGTTRHLLDVESCHFW